MNSLAAVASEDLLEAGMQIKIPSGKGALYAKWMSLGFGLVSFGLVFVVERLGGILQATLTLNGLIGGVTLGLFSLGIFFRRANSKGALFGGIVSLVLVIVVGVLAQLNNEETPPLPTSMDGCNATIMLHSPPNHAGITYELIPSDGSVSLALQHHGGEAFEHLLTIATKEGWSSGGNLENNFYRLSNEDVAEHSTQSDVLKASTRQEAATDAASSWFVAVYQISYMWYSCLGTLLTVIFGLLISLFTSDNSWSCWHRSTVVSVLPTNNGALTSKESIHTVTGSGTEKRAKLSVGSMAPLALMMCTSVKHSPVGDASNAKSKEILAHEASIGSSVASLYSIDQQTITSELEGSYTEEDAKEDPIGTVPPGTVGWTNRGGISGYSTFSTTQSSGKVESERF
uniref:Uncharacterized protein n=1 Tax=Anopheles culicifacies TaxID=139723 RepID=A0A182MG39_9DIPT